MATGAIFSFKQTVLVSFLLGILVACGQNTAAPAATVAPTSVSAAADTTPLPTDTPEPEQSPLPTPVVAEPVVSLPSPVSAGEVVGVSVAVDAMPGADITYEWSVAEGQGEIQSGQGTNAVTVQVPDEPGTYAISVKVTTADVVVERAVFVTVEEPPETPRPVATETPAATATPPITLTSLQDGQSVPCENVARGTYTEEVTEPIWPVVLINGRWYPQDQEGQPASKISGTWSTIVRFGNCDDPQSDVGKQFQLLVIRGVEACHQLFAEAFASGDFSGIPDSEVPAVCKEPENVPVAILLTRK